MLDFTSSCYLGIDHSSHNIKPWAQLTTGKPSALYEPQDHRRLAKKIATLQGLEAGAIAKSTLHLFWDLFGILGRENLAAFVDSQAYPIAQWGLERFAFQGNDVIKFMHHHPGHLSKALKARLLPGERPLIVTDGWCTHCGKMAPLQAYLNCARTYNGLLIIDDTQALGIFGTSPTSEQPYGVGGGGSLQYLNLYGPDIILVSSLAKAFGVPIAVISGSKPVIDKFCDLSKTRVHCSPPSYAEIYAAEHALQINTRQGNQIRLNLFSLIRGLKKSLLKIDIKTVGSLFPAQKPLFYKLPLEKSIYASLINRDVRTVPLQNNSDNINPDILFLLTSKHKMDDIKTAVKIINGIISGRL